MHAILNGDSQYFGVIITVGTEEMIALKTRLADDSRGKFYQILLGVWAMVALYAMAHDQYIVRIAPQHFALYHPRLFPIADLKLFALMYSFVASFSPGLALGTAAFFVARAGSLPKIPVRAILAGAAIVIILTEATAAMLGVAAYISNAPVLPAILYPEMTRPILVTQTIQLTCYPAAACFSLLFLALLPMKRRRLGCQQSGGACGLPEAGKTTAYP